MRSFLRIILLVAVFFLWACPPKPMAPPRPEEKVAGSALFSEAETFFREKSFGKALTAYNGYLAEFPAGPFAAASLMKIGAIYQLQNRISESRDLYRRLISEHPDSVFVPEARIKILQAYFKERNYQEVIRQGTQTVKELKTTDRQVQAYLLLADSYMAIQAPAQAVPAYMQAYNKADETNKIQIRIRIKAAVSRLKTAEIISLLNQVEDRQFLGDLMYQMGLNYYAEENYLEARRALSDFIGMFKDHENTREAENLIEKLNAEHAFNREKIGCLLPLTGPYAAIGKRALMGVELAVNLSASGKAPSSIQVIVKDTGSNPETAARAVRELYHDKVAAIIGPIITAEAAALEAQKLKIPIITLTQKSLIAETGDYVFRNFFTPEMQVKAMLSYGVKKLGLKRFAILYPDEKYGTTFMNLFWDEVIAQQGTVVGVESYSLEQTDFAAPIKKLVGLYYDEPEDIRIKKEALNSILGYHDYDRGQARPADRGKDTEPEPEPIVDFDAVFIPDAPRKVGLIIPQLAYYDVEDVYLFGTNLWHSDQLVQMARQFVQGAIFTDGFFVESKSPHVKEFVNKFNQIYGSKPEFIEAIAYDTAKIMIQTVRRPEVRSRSQLRDALISLQDFEGVTGLTSFGPSGDVRKDLYLLRVKKDEFIELKTR
ncbi:MAG: penicillin-binding protein activator [Desulfobacterales bacterium]|nr:penicillin-binding protein activator [Desulfobacterales bacterium]